METGGVTISGVRGMGGIGKTALALKLAQELTSCFPAQIYLDLQGVSARPVTPVQAMTHVVRAFRPDTRLPDSEAEIAALYRSVLHGQSVLLLMDNASSADQVIPLIPPEGCLLLVTSRFLFHVPGLRTKDLETLPSEKAQALLLKIEPRIGDQAIRIAEICAGLPFALRQAAGALGKRPDLTPESYAQRLEEDERQVGLVDASLRLSYDLLPENLAHRWRALSVFPADFDVPAASTIWHLELEKADATLGELVRWSLVEGKAGRYRLHDLARVFARGCASENERIGVKLRFANYYRDLLDIADRLYLQGEANLLDGLRVVDSEWLNIQEGQAWAAAHAASNQDAAYLAWGYPDAGINCLCLRLSPQERVRWLETALVAARQLDKRHKATTLGNLGQAYADLGKTRRAIEIYEQHLAIVRENGDRQGEGHNLISLGLANAALGMPRRSIELYEQALIIAQEIPDRLMEENAMGNLGLAYVYVGDSRFAIRFFEKALTIAQEIGDRRGEGIATGNLGLALAALGEPRRAIECYEKALAIAQKLRDRLLEGNATGNLGLAYAALKEPHRAIESYQRQLAIAREIHDRRGEGNALGSLGSAYLGLGEISRAIELQEQHFAIAREIGDRRGEATACWHLGLALEQTGELDRAIEVMQACVDYEREIGRPDAEEDAAYVESLRARSQSGGNTPQPTTLP